MTIPFPTTEELDAIYSENYDYNAHSLIESEKRWRSRKLVELMSSASRGASLPIRAALDVGCMYGYLLEELRARGVNELHGIEISEEPAAVAAAKGFIIHRKPIDVYAATHPGISFDVVFAQHVLEHVRDPALFLRAAFELLRPGGKLVLAVPHLESRTRTIFGGSWGWYQVPVHLFHFSKTALAKLCQQAGFVVNCERVRGGDSLFVLITANQFVRGGAPPRSPSLSKLGKLVVRSASVLLRPYLYLGDEELVLVATKPAEAA